MICIRCNKEFDTTEPVFNAENFKNTFFSCPHCHKLYYFYKIVQAKPIDDNVAKDEFCDDYGHDIVLNKNYNK